MRQGHKKQCSKLKMAALTWACMVFMIHLSHLGISSANRTPPAPSDTSDKPNRGGKLAWGGGGFQIGGYIPGLGWGIIHDGSGNPFFAGGGAASGCGGRGSPDYGGLGGSSTGSSSGCSGGTGDGPGGGVGGSGSGSGSISGGFFLPLPGLGNGSFGAPLFCIPPLGCFHQYGNGGYGTTDARGNYDGGGYGTIDDHGPHTPVSGNSADDRSNGYDVHHKDNREIYGKALSSRKMKWPSHGANGDNVASEHVSEPIASGMAPDSD